MQIADQLFKDLNISVDNNQRIHVVNVDVDVLHSKWILNLHSEYLISADYLHEIRQGFKQKFGNQIKNIEFNFSLTHQLIKDQEISRVLSHYNYLRKNNALLMSAFSNISAAVVDGNIEFEITSEYDKSLVTRNIHALKEEFFKLGISDFEYTYNLVIQEQDDKLEEIKKRREQDFYKLTEAQNDGEFKPTLLFGDNISSRKVIKIEDVLDENNILHNCTIEGIIFELELRETKANHLLIMDIYDGTSTITVKAFPGWGGKPPTIDHLKSFKKGMMVKIFGRKQYDKYSKDETIMIDAAMVLSNESPVSIREDEAEVKRVELHMHTKMSRNNGIGSLAEYSALANHFGHTAIAITDHNIVQAYTESESLAKKYNLKMIYGLEAVVARDTEIVFNPTNERIDNANYVVFDLETTGFSANFNKLIEIGAVKVHNGQIIDKFQRFIKIDIPVPEIITNLTGITDDDLAGGVELKNALTDFYEWSKDHVLVAHNAMFDMQFLARNYERTLNMTVTQPVLDTLELSRFLNPESTYHSLKILAKKYQVPLDSSSHHRADYDAEKLTEIFVKMLNQINEHDISTLIELNEKNPINKTRGFHNLIYVANQAGLRNMYELVSDANTRHFQMEPRVIKSNLARLRENLIYVGGGCAKSEIVDAYLNQSASQFKSTLLQFDFIEVMPVSNLYDLLNNGVFSDVKQIKQMHIDIINLAKELNIKVIATGNVHYPEPEMSIAKEILYAKDFKPEKVKKNELGIEEFIDKIKFKKWVDENKIKNNNQYYFTTQEMYDQFDYLEKDILDEIIVTNTNYLADSTDILKIIPDDLYTPEVEGVDQKLTDMVYEKARSIYGEELPEIVEKRIEKEVKSITKYGFSIVYYISHKLVKYSLDNDYLVGSRGSVGSSLVATFMDITEINPLAPHYVCPKCQVSEFITDGSIGSGYDLPNKMCEHCGSKMIKDGQDIPFETFLGFEGDKVPDIDLNFSGEFQAKAHNYVRAREEMNDEELFDVQHAFKAGTIGTIQDRTAYAYVDNYFKLIERPARKTDINYYKRYCMEIKRTTGQHPGGIIVVPAHRDIYEFTPIQYPADDTKQPWRTTHFDFHSIHDNLLKLDILGHDDPTMLKRLKDSTGVDPKYLDIGDKKVLELFTSTNSLNLIDEVPFDLGTLGVPEFGTGFVQQMLKDTKPKTFAELVQISGLSHGTDVWLGNAQTLIEQNICELKDVIGCRDDIMVYLMYQGLEPLTAFQIMENVRKGKGLSPTDIEVMKANEVPDWYIDSCQKIKYMFPKAHAAAYVLMALRIAYYKVYYPLDYYAAYFSSRINDFDAQAMIGGQDVLLSRIELIDSFELSDDKKKSVLNSLKMSLEMVNRGYKFIKFDLNKSDSFNFVIDREANGLIMPFKTIDGLGEKEALRIVEEREIADFVTVEDFKKRTKVKKKSFETLEFFEAFKGLDIDSQTTLF